MNEKSLASTERFAAIARDAAPLGADHLVLTGDVTAYALDEEFAAARKALSQNGS